MRLNRLTQVYGDIYWKEVVGSVDGFDVQMNALMRKRAAIGDECRNLLNLHYDEHLGRFDDIRCRDYLAKNLVLNYLKTSKLFG